MLDLSVYQNMLLYSSTSASPQIILIWDGDVWKDVLNGVFPAKGEKNHNKNNDAINLSYCLGWRNRPQLYLRRVHELNKFRLDEVETFKYVLWRCVLFLHNFHESVSGTLHDGVGLMSVSL